MLILLDIDGVMVPANSWKKPEILEDGFPGFSPKAIKALQKIFEKTSADVVLTTSHKSKYSPDEWKNIFKKRGIDIKKISRLPENTTHLSRKQEIIDWFKNNDKINLNFVIIDDDKTLNSLPDFLKNKLVQTSGSVGLTGDLADKAIKILTKREYEFV